MSPLIEDSIRGLFCAWLFESAQTPSLRDLEWDDPLDSWQDGLGLAQ